MAEPKFQEMNGRYYFKAGGMTFNVVIETGEIYVAPKDGTLNINGQAVAVASYFKRHSA